MLLPVKYRDKVVCFLFDEAPVFGKKTPLNKYLSSGTCKIVNNNLNFPFKFFPVFLWTTLTTPGQRKIYPLSCF